MSGETPIKLRLDPENPPPLTGEQIAMLDALDKMPDSEIDYSDIPRQDFSRGARKKYHKIHHDFKKIFDLFPGLYMMIKNSNRGVREQHQHHDDGTETKLY